MKLHKIFVLLIAGVALSACETTSSRPYDASTTNVLQIKSKLGANNAKVQVGPVDLAPDVNGEPTCRMLGALDVGAGRPVSSYIQEALREELFLADAYDSNSNVIIEATVDKLEFDSFGQGTWDIGLVVRSSVHDGYRVETNYTYKSSFSALRACQNVVDAFNPTVNELISAVINHPEFSALTGADGSAGQTAAAQSARE